jgi:hypothetical protein
MTIFTNYQAAGWSDIATKRDLGNVWQKSIVSKCAGANVKAATEGAARNTVAEGLSRRSRINIK